MIITKLMILTSAHHHLEVMDLIDTNLYVKTSLYSKDSIHKHSMLTFSIPLQTDGISMIKLSSKKSVVVRPGLSL